MTGPAPSPEPAAGVPADADVEVPADADADAGADAEALPADRAGRRARKSGQLPPPSGPQSAEHTRRGKGPRSHTKRI